MIWRPCAWHNISGPPLHYQLKTLEWCSLYTCSIALWLSNGTYPSNTSTHVNFINFYEIYPEKITRLIRKHVCLYNKFWNPSSIIKSFHYLAQPTRQLFLLLLSNVSPLEQVCPITRLLILLCQLTSNLCFPILFAWNVLLHPLYLLKLHILHSHLKH